MRTITTFTTVSVAMALTGCATVKFWERRNIAKPQMTLELYLRKNALRAFFDGSRLVVVGSNEKQGGGCDCY